LLEHIAFAKLSGSGNDHICVDSRDGRFDELLASPERVGHFVRTLCQRGLGVGADGLIFAGLPQNADEADVAIRHFDPDGTEAERFPELTGRIAELEARRKEMSQGSCTPEQMSGIWKEIKGLQAQLLDRTVRRIARDWQVRDLDYWDSRGALLPWTIALGGRHFHEHLVTNAEIYEEPQHRPA
jgi:hypothetical protein